MRTVEGEPDIRERISERHFLANLLDLRFRPWRAVDAVWLDRLPAAFLAELRSGARVMFRRRRWRDRGLSAARRLAAVHDVRLAVLRQPALRQRASVQLNSSFSPQRGQEGQPRRAGPKQAQRNSTSARLRRPSGQSASASCVRLGTALMDRQQAPFERMQRRAAFPQRREYRLGSERAFQVATLFKVGSAGSVTLVSRSQPSFSSLMCSMATALAFASRSGMAWYSETQQR